MAKNDEPQSYGSQKDWLTGKTGEKVNNPKATPPAEHDEFYDNRRESESNGPHEGGHVSDAQLADNAKASGGPKTEEKMPTQKVTDQEGGAKRGGFFKERDYK